MLGCTGHRTRTVTCPEGGEELASDKQCQCVYTGLVEKVPFDEAKQFEEQQSEAESGEDIEIPDNIQRSSTAAPSPADVSTFGSRSVG